MRRTPLARPLTAVAAAALLAGVLTACTGGPFGGCEPVFQPGDASSTVTASGEVGETPVVDYPTPLVPRGVERSVLVEGDGAEITEGATVRLEVTMLDAASDAVIAEGEAMIAANDTLLGLGESLICANDGSRLALVGTPEELGLNATGPVVVVLDIVDVFLAKANGANQLPLDGMPTVVTAVDGTPGIAVGYATAPDDVRVSTIKAGSGAVVEDGDTVVIHGRSWTWPEDGDPSIGQLDTWTRFQPQTLDVDAAGENEVVTALEGAKVGSQLLIVAPAVDQGTPTIFVIDVLGILGDD